MFLDIYENSPSALAGIRPGHVLFSVNGRPVSPPVEPSFLFGADHTLIVARFDQDDRREAIVRVPPKKGSKRRPPIVEPQSVSYRILKPGLGLLRVPFFSGAFGIRFSKALDSAMKSLMDQGCDRLIIDLRGCLGGSLGFARLVSYLCPGRIPIGYDITRRRLLRGYDVRKLPRVPMPSTRAALLQCLLRFSLRDKSLVLMTQGLGPQPFHGRTAILINEFTNSAGEMAAQFAKDANLATLIGRKTMGNVLGGTMLDVGSGYRIYLPIFGWYSPDGTYAEGVGIEPDLEVDIDPNDLAGGEDGQLNKAVEVLGGNSGSTTS
jgi:C-terminal processing protease CtpA/Prc